MALDRLERQVLAKFKTESPTSRFKVLSANAFGREKAAACADLLQQIEARWQERFRSGQDFEPAVIAGSLDPLRIE